MLRVAGISARPASFLPDLRAGNFGPLLGRMEVNYRPGSSIMGGECEKESAPVCVT